MLYVKRTAEVDYSDSDMGFYTVFFYVNGDWVDNATFASEAEALEAVNDYENVREFN